MMVAELQNVSAPDPAQGCRRLALVLGMTKQMLVHAENDEWERVAEMEMERRDDLMACFSQPIPAADTELLAEAMATLLYLNEELMAKLKTARAEVMAQGRDIQQNRNAIHSYKEVDTSL